MGILRPARACARAARRSLRERKDDGRRPLDASRARCASSRRSNAPKVRAYAGGVLDLDRRPSRGTRAEHGPRRLGRGLCRPHEVGIARCEQARRRGCIAGEAGRRMPFVLLVELGGIELDVRRRSDVPQPMPSLRPRRVSILQRRHVERRHDDRQEARRAHTEGGRPARDEGEEREREPTEAPEGRGGSSRPRLGRRGLRGHVVHRRSVAGRLLEHHAQRSTTTRTMDEARGHGTARVPRANADQSTARTIFPNTFRSSSSRCASAALHSGMTRSTTGRSLPCST